MRYERVGLPRDMVDPGGNIRSAKRYIDAGPGTDYEHGIQSLVNTASLIAIQYYLLEDLSGVREWARRALSAGEDYFLGPWRDRVPSGNYHDQPPSRAWQDRNRAWHYEFQACLIWGACLGEWDQLARIARSIPDDRELDVEQSRENWAWLLIACGVVRGRSWADMDEWVSAVRQGRRKRERLLLGFLDTILHGDDKSLAQNSRDYFQHYRKAEIKREDITSKIAIDATFLVHFGRLRGREVALPSGMEDHVVADVPHVSN